MPTRWIVLSGLVVARLAFAFQLQSLAVVAPGLTDDLGLDGLAIGSLVGLFMAPGIFLSIPGGVLGQWFGERRFLVACLAAMTAGGLLCGLADGYWMLWIGRLAAGLGAVGINVVMTKIVVDWFADKELATAMALYLAGYPIGLALALVTLGRLATAAAWPLAFFAAAAFSLVALIAFVATYRAAETAGVAAARAVWPSPGEVVMVCLAGLSWGLFNAGFIIMVSFVPLYLVSEGMAAATATSLVGIGLWVSLVAVPLGGFMVDRFGRANLVIVAGVLFWGVGLLLMLPWSQSIPLLVFLFATTIIAGSLPPAPMVALVAEVARPEMRAASMGIFYTWLYGGIALGPVLGGFVSDFFGNPVAPVYTITGLAVLTIVVLGIFRALQARGMPAAIHRQV